MSVIGLQKQTIEIPLAAGLNQKMDARALESPSLEVCKDVQFDEVGGLQLRKPFSNIGSSIYPSGTISNLRRIYAYGDELIAFTKDSLYTWNANLSKWVLRGTHLAAKTTEKAVFIQTTDQVDTDRCELSGTVFYTWTDSNGISIAAVDKTTGSVALAPSPIASCSRGRLVALSGENLVLWFFKNPTGGLTCASYNPDTPQAGAVAETEILAAANFNDYYDVVASNNGTFAYLACRRDTTTSYTVFQIGPDTAIENSATPARTCDGPIAIAMAPNSTHLTVVRDDGANIEGDYLTVGLVDVTVNQAIGDSTGNTTQIAACYRTTAVSGSTYRLYVFWNSATESAASSAWSLKYNTVDTDGTIGTQNEFVDGQGLASRAFDHEGRVFVHTVFAGTTQTGVAGISAQIQNSYFLYRDDQLLVAKEAMNVSDTYRSAAGQIGRLPGVQSLGSGVYAWCGPERRLIPLGGAGQGYSDRSPRDITIEFDSNEARRVARLGQTLYITGGELMQFDGVKLTEVGFHWFPWSFTPTAAGSGGNIEAGTYTYKITWRWDNAKGERDRSTTATTRQVTCVANDEVAINSVPTLTATHKTAVAVEIWRTAKNPDIDFPFYLVTSQDPAATGDNPYVAMPAIDSGTASVNAIPEVLSDANLIIREANNENGGVLEAVAPPPATIIAASDERLFLAGVPGDPDNVWYSKLHEEGYVATFNDALKVGVPKAGGDITALALLVGTLVVFRESAIYVLPGDGFDNTGGGVNYGPARTVSQDVGAVSAEAVALTPMGLVFKSSKGWYLLSQGFGLEYIGAPVSDYDSDTVYAVHVVESQHQIRCLTNSRMLVLDYIVNQWSEWTISDGLHAAIWNGTYHYLATATVNAEQSTYSANADQIDVETPWIALAGKVGRGRVWRLVILGEYRSAHHLRIRVYYNYVNTAVDDIYWTPSPTTVGDGLIVRQGISRQSNLTAIKIRLTPVSDSNHSNPPAGEALKLTMLGLEVGIQPGLRKLPSAQTQ